MWNVNIATSRRLRGAIGLGVLANALLIAGALMGTPAQAAPSQSVVAHIGHLEIIDPFLPDPASPSVASVYLTVKNTGSVTDELISVSSPAASYSMLMTESEHGSAGTMEMLRDVRIPAHGEATLSPGHDHVMLQSPKGKYRVGQKVLLTLRFEKAGTLTLKVPVVPLDRILG